MKPCSYCVDNKTKPITTTKVVDRDGARSFASIWFDPDNLDPQLVQMKEVLL